MNRIEKNQYKKALKIIETYPEALKIVERYETTMNKSIRTIIQSTANFKLEEGFINLDKLLSIRSKKILKTYFKDYHNIIIKLEKFEIVKLLDIDLDKLSEMRNCGKHTLDNIFTVVKYYTSK